MDVLFLWVLVLKLGGLSVAFRGRQRQRPSESIWNQQQRAGGSSLQSEDTAAKVSGCTSFHKFFLRWRTCESVASVIILKG